MRVRHNGRLDPRAGVRSGRCDSIWESREEPKTSSYLNPCVKPSAQPCDGGCTACDLLVQRAPFTVATMLWLRRLRPLDRFPPSACCALPSVDARKRPQPATPMQRGDNGHASPLSANRACAPRPALGDAGREFGARLAAHDGRGLFGRKVLARSSPKVHGAARRSSRRPIDRADLRPCCRACCIACRSRAANAVAADPRRNKIDPLLQPRGIVGQRLATIAARKLATGGNPAGT